MKYIYYSFGYLHGNNINLNNRNGLKYLENNVLSGDIISTVYKTVKGLQIELGEKSFFIEDEIVSASINLNYISLINSNDNGMILNKNDINEKDKYMKLTGKWKEISCFSNCYFIGVSKMQDLFYIDLKNPQNLRMEFFPFSLKIDSVACGSDHILILSTYPGRVFSKGLGSRGQLGHNDLEESKDYKEISNLGCIVKKIACGLWHSVCQTEAGDVYSWGWNQSGQLGVPCFSDASVLRNYFKNIDDLETPLAIHSTPVLVQFPLDDWSIIDVSCGSRHTVCLNEDGQVFCFGWGGMGQLGRDDGESYDFPILLEGFKAKTIKCTQWGTILTVPAHPEAMF